MIRSRNPWAFIADLLRQHVQVLPLADDEIAELLARRQEIDREIAALEFLAAKVDRQIEVAADRASWRMRPALEGYRPRHQRIAPRRTR